MRAGLLSALRSAVLDRVMGGLGAPGTTQWIQAYLPQYQPWKPQSPAPAVPGLGASLSSRAASHRPQGAHP